MPHTRDASMDINMHRVMGVSKLMLAGGLISGCGTPMSRTQESFLPCVEHWAVITTVSPVGIHLLVAGTSSPSH